jgi:cytochrome c553
MKKWLISISIITVVGSSSIAQSAVIGNPEAGKAKIAVCAGCHGSDGNSPAPNFPSLAGQHPNYLQKQIVDFQTQKRQDPMMSSQAQALATSQEVADVSAYFAQQKLALGIAKPEAVTLGTQVFRGGNLATGVTACTACHGPVGMGNLPAGFPRISGQKVDYTVKALKDFRAGTRNNDMNGMMRGVSKHMTDEEITAVAQYLHGLSD